ncbi:MAG: hypothetical protein ACI8PZ_002084 [Myxococcota bacterium]
MIAWLAIAANASTIGACVTVDGGAVPLAAVQAMAWHALRDAHGHDAHLVACNAPDLAAQLEQRQLVTLIHTAITWLPHNVERDGVYFATRVPNLTVTELQVVHGALTPRRTWSVLGTPTLATRDDTTLSLPDLSVQDAMARALRSVPRPAWRGAEPPRLRVPVRVVADEEYRQRHGDRWRDEAAARLNRASDILAQAGLSLEVVGYGDWASTDSNTGLAALLRELSHAPTTDGAIRIGFTGQPERGSRYDATAEDVGRAWTPGRDVLLVDQASTPGVEHAWDVADEGVALAHEVLHALGVPHVRQPWFVMSEVKLSTVAMVAPSSQALARASAQARWAHWEPVAALGTLAAAAAEHLDDEEIQVEYVLDNLLVGPGMPEPGSASPGQLSALGNVAMGRHLLNRSRHEPDRAAALRQQALAHSVAAAQVRPVQARALIADLQEPAQAPPPDPRQCSEEWGPWVTAECAAFDQ